MATTWMMIIAASILGITVVDACPIATYVNGSCCEAKGNGFQFSTSLKSRVYNITNFCGNCELVAEGYCDANTDGGGWLVIQRRQDGSVDFNRNWVDYEDGFGSLTGEFWYGLHAIHCLTNQGKWELRVDYMFTNGTKGYLSYSDFRVGPASKQYPLTLAGFSGATTDPMSDIVSYSLANKNIQFSTYDRDNDRFRTNCAAQTANGKNGGWWFTTCGHIRPNVQFKDKYAILLNNKWFALMFTELKIRPKNCIL